MDGEEHVVEQLAAVGDFAELLAARLELGRFAASGKDLAGNLDGAVSAQAQEGDGARAKGSCNGGDGVHWKKG